MAKEAARRKEEEEYLRDTIDSERRAEADNYQFPPTPANDNEPRSYSNTNIRNVRSERSGRQIPKLKKKPTKVSLPSRDKGSRNIVLSWRNFGIVAGATALIYPLQIWCGIFCLVGFGTLAGVESDWLLAAVNFGTFDTLAQTGGGLLVLGMAGGFLCGFVGFLGATVMFTAFDRSILHEWSILILTVCLVGLLVPVINLFPVMLFWYWYVSFAK